MMNKYIIAYDLGTGGNKASLYNQDGQCLSECFASYHTSYPRSGWHEQSPSSWWKAVVDSTHQLLQDSKINTREIVSLGISGQSLGAVPLGKDGQLLRDMVPIWSDSRAVEQAKKFFAEIPEANWYQITGNGFPAPLYTIFKVMWYRDEEPAMFDRVHKVLGSKDYINYRLTGSMSTDYSYASGSGVYDLHKWEYNQELIDSSRLPSGIFPNIVSSTEVIGTLTLAAAAELGLPGTVKVVSGGVDNSCMALGARAMKEGRIYNSQGSSSWIAVTSSIPLLDARVRPYVFTHVVPGMFTSAVSTFAAGSCFRWARENLCRDLKQLAMDQNVDIYDLMTAEAAQAPVGAHGLLFNPNMAGGTSLSSSINIRGGFFGLDLGHTRSDMLRAIMEGIAMDLRVALDALRKMTPISEEMLVVGGGSRSKAWQQIFSDIYNMRIIKTNIDQQAAALGAATCAAVGANLWPSFDFVDEIHQVESTTNPDPKNTNKYERMLPIFIQAEKYCADLGDKIAALNLME